MAGAFQTTRDIFDNPIWRNIVEFRLFFLIYGNAAFKDGVKAGDIVLRRGQWVRSYRNLRDDLEYIENRSIKKYSLSTINRAVENLVKQNRIIVKQCELGTLFEVVNYSKYQDLQNYRNNIENGERTERERRQNNNNKDNNLLLSSINNKNLLPEDRNSPGYKKLEELSKKILGW